MSDSVAIALVTALSTLFGVGVTGLVTLWTTSRQLKSQELAMARQLTAQEWATARQLTSQERQWRGNHEEQRAVRKRELRREVFVRFLNEAAALDSALTLTWDTPLPQDGDSVFKDLRARTLRLREIRQVLDMEGPERVTEAALNVRAALQRQIDRLGTVAHEARDQGTAHSLVIFASDAWLDHQKDWETAREAFRNQASSALD